MSDLQSLSAEWLTAKSIEREAMEDRRQIEDAMLSLIGLPEAFEGTESAEAPGGYEIKMMGRLNRKIDAEALQEIAAENGITEHLSTLFRWKPSIDAKRWAAADENITRPLLDAITTTPGRPSFAIIKEEK